MTDFLQWLHLCKLLISMFLLANCFAKIHLCIEKQKLLTIIEVNLKRKNDGQNHKNQFRRKVYPHICRKLAEFNGKQFLKDTVGTTGCEISFGTIEPGQAAPFFHSHKQNEEIYIILSGAGDFQVNDTAFPIAEGSIVRVATACNRSIRCTSTEKCSTSAFRQKKVVSNNVLWRTVKSPNKKQMVVKQGGCS